MKIMQRIEYSFASIDHLFQTFVSSLNLTTSRYPGPVEYTVTDM